jgi:hypothetical protein
MDKNGPGPGYVPKGKAYCEKPGTSCWYNERDVCRNCGRPKGWRVHKMNRAHLDRIAGR